MNNRPQLCTMQRFQIPQFIEIEDKVIGPFTIKQALYLGGGALLIVFLYMFLQPFLFWPLAIIVGAFASALAFLKINDQPFALILKNAASYILKPRLYIWKKRAYMVQKTEQGEEQKQRVTVKSSPKLAESKLTDLAWSLDVIREENE